MKKLFGFCFLLLLLGGCKKEEKIPLVSFEVDGKNSCEVSELFTDREIIFLETKPEAFLGWISKIIRFEDKIYILDKGANSIVVFDTTGKYVSAIRPAGQGPREYVGLSDFTICPGEKELIVHTHLPGKLLFYDTDCRFKKELPYRPLASAMIYDDDRLVLVNSLQKDSPYFTFLSFDGEKEIAGKQASAFTEEINSDQYTMGALLLKGEKLTFARRFENTLYSLEGEKVVPRYQLDFKEHNVPEGLRAPREEEGEKREQLQKGKYFFSLVDVKETPSCVYFKTNQPGVMRIVKKTSRGEYWNHFTDQELGLQHSWTIGVEDPSNRMVCFFHPIFLTQLALKDKWERLPSWLSDKLKNMDEGSNPLLIFYKSKE